MGTHLHGGGRGLTVSRPACGDALVDHFAFSLPNLSIPRGARVTWRFDGSTAHDATLTSGPGGFASPSARGGARWSRRFAQPGEYRIACSLHPVYMSQYLRVRG
jgi:plastocyanin